MSQVTSIAHMMVGFTCKVSPVELSRVSPQRAAAARAS